MVDRQIKAQVNRAVGFVQRHWQRLRAAAANAYSAYGRGAFLFGLTTYETAFDSTPAELTYLDEALTSNFSDGLARISLGAELQSYDPRRQIVFVFWHDELEQGFIRVLTESLDGNPRTGLDRRWNNATRACPKCNAEFVEAGPWGKCPQCGNEFVADDENQKTDMARVPPIVDI
jgi:hypothetical protein